jgi:hypothetical protein
MKRMLADLYKLDYKMVKNKSVATILAIAVMSFLSFIIIQGVMTLMADMLPAFTQRIFKLPYSVILAFILFLFYFRLMPSQYLMLKEKERKIRPTPILLFTAAAVISIIYVQFWSKITF